MKKILQLVLLFATLQTFAQAPAIEWQKCYGGTGSEKGNSIVQTNDGGYIIAGHTNSTDGDVTSNHGNYDYWVVKVDHLGSIEWQKTYGGSFDEQAKSIIQTNDGGYIVAGDSASENGDITNFHGNKDYWILKLDPVGTIEWQRKYGGDDSESAYQIKQTTDGGYIVTGETYCYDGIIKPVNGDVTGFHGLIDGWIVKLNGTGVIEWQKCFSAVAENSWDNFLTVQQTSDGGYVTAGTYSTYGFWVVKLDSNGNAQWQYVDSDSDVVYSIAQTPDGGYIMVGDALTRLGNVTGHNFGINKISALGTLEWKKSYGGDGFFDIARSVKNTPDGGYIITGNTNSDWSGNVGPSNGAQDVWVLKLNGAGALQWQKCFGGTMYDWATEVQVTSNRGYIISGFTESNNRNVSGNHGAWDIWVLKLAPDRLLATENIMDAEDEISFYPNPAINKITFTKTATKVSVFTVIGTNVLEVENVKEFDISDLKRGNYLLKIATRKGTFHKKLIKE